MKWNIINRDEIPEDLPLGTYATTIVDAYFEKGELVIDLKFDPNRQAEMHLVKLVKGESKRSR